MINKKIISTIIKISTIILFAMNFVCDISAQQISIGRIEQMPNYPLTYDLPDFKSIAVGYDSLIFDLNSSGNYLPAIFINGSTINYHEHNSFGIHSYIGTVNAENGEAINVLPAVVSASLNGIDKTNDRGYNWVLMCEEYFNKRSAENVYLNGPQGSSGGDWWYDTMPNIFFYQLNDLYPGTGDFDYQFVKIADQWLTAIENMSARATPWRKAVMYYRAWSLSTMTGNSTGVLEPEAAGAIAWLLYNAYVETGDEKYRIGAEWSLEFLDGLSDNPSYELQLSYGALVAARMNAEVGTDYDLNKILNWCFNVGQLRNWGAIVGKWGDYEVNGLIGEVNGNNDYAFAMNTFEQIGALVPLVRYDEQYARAIGKWTLNAANSARLFYPKYLPDENQENEDWAKVNDPNSYIAYEALREDKNMNSPFATGDAVAGGWAATNLGLYGSSHVGILGGIIDTTNVSKILQLDLLKTDYYHSETYPTFLYYNPYNESKTVKLNLQSGSFDIYESVNNNFIQHSVSGEIDLIIEGNSAIIVVIIPSGGDVNFDLHKMFINGKIVDYNSANLVDNHPPRLKALAISDSTVTINSTIPIYATAVDLDGDELRYAWEINGEIIEKDSSIINWIVPNQKGSYNVRAIVSDIAGDSDTLNLIINVTEEVIEPPKIEMIKASPRKIDLSNESSIECIVLNESGEILEYQWSARFGSLSGSGSQVVWQAPSTEGNYFIGCNVINQNGFSVSDSIEVIVRDFSLHEKGTLVAHYPFTGNVNDESGNNLNGELKGPDFTKDRFGTVNSAVQFDGSNDYIIVENNSLLNFTQEISVNFWMMIDQFYEREAYPISHGNWENRWKASITNNKLRWTIKTSNGIVDLDTETELETRKWYFVSLQYSGADLEIFLDNNLDAFKYWSGSINSTTIDLTIGQALPTNNSYNFAGKLDDIRIYDYALSNSEINELYDINTKISDDRISNLPQKSLLKQNFPNPFNGQTNIGFYIKSDSFVNLSIYDLLGRKVKTLIAEKLSSGWHDIAWNFKDTNGSNLASGVYIYRITAKRFVESKKMLLIQ